MSKSRHSETNTFPNNRSSRLKRMQQFVFRRKRQGHIVTKYDEYVLHRQPTLLSDSTQNTILQKALVVESQGQYRIRHDFPMPQINEREVMIRTRYVGLNPIDWKSVDYNFCLPSFPWVTGREASGEVVEIGTAVKGIRRGVKIWTSTYYRDVRAGCFQDYVVVPEHTVMPVPDNVPMEAAACFGVAAMTACLTLWKYLSVPFPQTGGNPQQLDQKDTWLLIWGGSTITGQFATQLAVLSGIKVITVNSEETAALSRKLGACRVITRDGKTEEQILDELRSATAGSIIRAIDLVGHATAALVLRAVSESKPVIFTPLAMMSPQQKVPNNVTVHTVEMKVFTLDPTTARYAHKLNELFIEGVITIPSLHILSGGIKDIITGLDILKKGQLRGKKLIVKM